jgi:type II secretory pathway component GspD/PulD (secretin)
MRYVIRVGAGVCAILAAVPLSLVSADDSPVKAVQETPLAAPAAAAPAMSSGGTMVITGPSGAVEFKPGDAMPGQPKPGDNPGDADKNKPGDGKKPGEMKPGETKPDEAIKPILHPTSPPKPPNPDEFKVSPNKNGEYSFNFNGQPWPGVLNWLAQISEMSLDWQEMPGDYLNLSTQRPYKVAEVRDLINRHLLARGFTLLSRGESLLVVSAKKLDLSLVPRISPEELKDHQPYEFVKVSFPLEKMTAEAAVQELDPMKSLNGKLIPLKLTNRLEAVDAVVNLQEIYALLKSEQSPSVPQRSVQEFVLQFARAEEVREQLETLLGKEKAPGMPQPGQGGQGGMPPEMMQAMKEQAEAMARHGGGGPEGGQQPGKIPSPQPTMSFVVNPHKNSIVAYAPPDKMALIDQIVKTLDVPVGSQSSLLANVGRTRVYRLTGVEPDTLVKTLREIANLDPTTSLKPDPKNRSIIVSGPLADHMIIGALVKKLNGSERQFAVRRLHRLAAEYVAGTVDFMINGEKKEKSRSIWDRFNSSGNDRNESSNTFRVDPDVEHNQLILWANEVELEDVDNLLRKLGEISVGEGPGMTRRVIDTAGSEEAKALLKQIERKWNTVAPNNPIEINQDAPKAKIPSEPPSTEPSAMQIEENQDSPLLSGKGPGLRAADDETQAPLVRFAQLGGDSAGERPISTEAKLPVKAPPVKVELTPDGQIVVTSDDPQALEIFQDLADQLAVPGKDYEVFHLNSCSAVDVAMTLDEFFKSEDKKTTPNVPYYMRWEFENMDKPDDKAGRLSRKRSLKFIADSESNSILVRGADSKQLATIRKLIDLYEQPLPEDAQLKRKSDLIPLEYSTAEVIVETVKEVYRDLLSANDKAFGGKNDRDSNRGFWGWDSDEDRNKKQEKSPKFKGKLSISADKVSNTIVLSAPATLFDEVKRLIEALDRAAAPASQMKVLKLGPGMRGPDIRRHVLEALGQEVPKEEASEKKKSSDENNPLPNGKKKNGNGAKNHKENS